MTSAAAVIQSVIDTRATPDALRWFASGLADGTVSDAQAGAFAMAVKLRGLSPEARTALTEGMRDSGDVLHWDMPGPVVDKHSTGGVGDCISLALAPALAACGVFVPMVSGRGLGHTGGTLDKLEAIPGYTVGQPEDRLRAITRAVGCAIVSATSRIAPADRRLYAIRDVTATIDSIDLITASILSKKLAAGLDALVLDVKTGSGAFLPGAQETRALAHALVDTANGAGCRSAALITDMNAPLGAVAGNALEVAGVMRFLAGGSNPDIRTLTLALGGEALAMAGMASDADDGAAQIGQALASGAAAERFGQMVAAQGGPVDFPEHWERYLPVAPVQRDIFPDTAGTVAAIDTRAVGLAVVALGGGRRREVGVTGAEVDDIDAAGQEFALDLRHVRQRILREAREAGSELDHSVRCSCVFVTDDGVADAADAGDLYFHDVAGLQRAHTFGRAGRDDVARQQRHDARDVRDDAWQAEDHVGGAAMLAHAAVDAADHLERTPVLVRPHVADGAECVEALRPRELDVELLQVACGHVVKRQEAGDDAHGLCRRHVPCTRADHHADLGLVLDALCVRRQHDCFAAADQRGGRLQEKQRPLRHVVAEFPGMRRVVAPDADDLCGGLWGPDGVPHKDTMYSAGTPSPLLLYE